MECERCGRETKISHKTYTFDDTVYCKVKELKSISVYHDSYGCDTGCCGHMITLEFEDGTDLKRFTFGHDKDELEFEVNNIIHTFGKRGVEKSIDIVENC